MENENQYDVIIVGAGMAGLVAAKACEKSGYSTLIIDTEKEVGGRVQTDHVNGFSLERGFQVLIDSYEKASELLNYEKLKLRAFQPGAKIYDEKGSYAISDPLRKITALPETALSRVGSISDKLKMLTLSKNLQARPLDEMFQSKSQSTLAYLKEYGFSGRIIENFFRPFFGGIFLERDLGTDAAMFRFVFRNFSKGNACIPELGMGAIPRQLLAELKKTDFKLHTRVVKVNNDPSVELDDGKCLKAKKVILACNPDFLLPQLDHHISWQKTTTMYFSGEKNLPSMGKLIGLDARKESSINNFARHDEVVSKCAPDDKSLWSVTVRKSQSVEEVKKDLSDLLRIHEHQLEFLQKYDIEHALPVVDNPLLEIPAEQTQVTEHIYLAGDFLTNASIDGAMRSGEKAAQAVIETLNFLSPRSSE